MTESLSFLNLFAGDFPRADDSVTLIGGQNLARGAVLGRITASGKHTLSLSAASDGSQTPVAILAEAVDASTGDKTAPVYLTGQFNSASLTFGTGHTAASVKAGLRALGLFLKTVA